MATDYGIEILVDSSQTDDQKSDVLREVLQALAVDTLALVYAASYSAGSSSVNEQTVTVGGASPDYGIRVVLDETVYGTNKLPNLVQRILQALAARTLTIANAATYTAGDRAYQVVITVT